VACVVGREYTLRKTDLLEAITVGQRNKELQESSAKAIMTTSALWDVALVSAQSLDCDNEIPGGAGFQNVSEGKAFTSCCSLKVCVRTLINIGIIYCDPFLSSNSILLENCSKVSLLALVTVGSRCKAVQPRVLLYIAVDWSGVLGLLHLR